MYIKAGLKDRIGLVLHGRQFLPCLANLSLQANIMGKTLQHKDENIVGELVPRCTTLRLFLMLQFYHLRIFLACSRTVWVAWCETKDLVMFEMFKQCIAFFFKPLYTSTPRKARMAGTFK